MYSVRDLQLNGTLYDQECKPYLVECVVVFGKVEDVEQSDGLLQLLWVVHVERLTPRQHLMTIAHVDKLFDGIRVLKNKNTFVSFNRLLVCYTHTHTHAYTSGRDVILITVINLRRSCRSGCGCQKRCRSELVPGRSLAGGRS